MNSHPTQIRAEMVGNVLAISVSVGEAIATGDVLLLLESMKMEIPVLSEIPGTVVEIAVAPGDVIQEGDLLIRLEAKV